MYCSAVASDTVESLSSISYWRASLVPRPYIQNYAHAVVACASGKEGSGTKLYPNADQGWNVRKGVRMQL